MSTALSTMLPLGISDFRQLRLAGARYIDKTAFISELLADPTQGMLFDGKEVWVRKERTR